MSTPTTLYAPTIKNGDTLVTLYDYKTTDGYRADRRHYAEAAGKSGRRYFVETPGDGTFAVILKASADGGHRAFIIETSYYQIPYVIDTYERGLYSIKPDPIKPEPEPITTDDAPSFGPQQDAQLPDSIEVDLEGDAITPRWPNNHLKATEYGEELHPVAEAIIDATGIVPALYRNGWEGDRYVLRLATRSGGRGGLIVAWGGHGRYWLAYGPTTITPAGEVFQPVAITTDLDATPGTNARTWLRRTVAAFAGGLAS